MIHGADTLSTTALSALGNALGAEMLTAVRLTGGYSNLTFALLDRGTARWVLRHPPPGPHDATAHDVLREARVLSGLEGSPVPVPRVALTPESGPDLGLPYTVVEFVPGAVLHAPEDVPGAVAEGDRPGLGLQLMTVLAAIHSADPAATGLRPSSRPGTYLERQIDRWAGRVGGMTDPLPAVTEELRHLAGTLPDPVGLVHGDFHLGNVIIGEQAEMRAVLDWEMATLGNPLADLGLALAYWQEPGDDPALAPLPSSAPGFPPRSALVAAYAEASGQEVDAIAPFVAFAQWKLACTAADILARLQSGALPGVGVDHEQVARQVPARARAAAAAFEGRW